MTEVGVQSLLRLEPEAEVRTQGRAVYLVLRRRRSVLWVDGAFPDWVWSCLANASSLEALMTRADERGGLIESARVQHGLARLAELRAIRLELRTGERILTSLRGASPDLLRAASPRLPEALALSAWTRIRREDDALVLENPSIQGELVLSGVAAGHSVWLTRHPIRAADVHAQGEPALSTLKLAAQAGFVIDPSRDERPAATGYWEFDDLHFHSQSRLDRQRASGATFRLLGRVDPPDVTKPSPVSDKVPLRVPETELDMPLTRVLQARRSWREQGERPIDVGQLGGVLYHGARMLGRQRAQHDEVARYVYPSAGARYPLEIYVCAGQCKGLASGLYRYLADEHALAAVAPDDERFRRLLSDAQVGTAPPQVALILAARFGRTLWKYEGIGYALILKDAGVLMQTLHLVATALGLGSCMVGSGDSHNFCHVAGLDGLVESSVGEMVLGSLPEPSGRTP